MDFLDDLEVYTTTVSFLILQNSWFLMPPDQIVRVCEFIQVATSLAQNLGGLVICAIWKEISTPPKNQRHLSQTHGELLLDFFHEKSMIFQHFRDRFEGK